MITLDIVAIKEVPKTEEELLRRHMSLAITSDEETVVWRGNIVSLKTDLAGWLGEHFNPVDEQELRTAVTIRLMQVFQAGMDSTNKIGFTIVKGE